MSFVWRPRLIASVNFFVVDNIEGSTDVGELLNFQHQVMEASDAGGSAQRQRVVTGVAVQEPQAQS